MIFGLIKPNITAADSANQFGGRGAGEDGSSLGHEGEDLFDDLDRRVGVEKG
jgi:hypothetical protein